MDIEPSGQCAGVTGVVVHESEHEGVPIHNYVEDSIEGIPEPSEGILYIVHKNVAKTLVNKGEFRGDILYVDTTELQNGCNALKRFIA